MKPSPFALLLTLLAALPAARADITYGWTETGSSYGNGSGTLTINTTPLGNGTDILFAGWGSDFAITSIQGAFGGAQITGLGDFHGNNVLDINSTNGVGLVAYADMSFNCGTNYYEFLDTVTIAEVVADDGNNLYFDAGKDAFSFVCLAPEPAQTTSGLLVAGLGALGLAVRRCRNRK